jgi:Carboxypeptidase regulatory-like domain
MKPWFVLIAVPILFVSVAHATIFGNVRGIIHDPSHRPVQGAQVTISSRTSGWTQTAESDAEGTFEFSAVPVGEYTLVVRAEGFASTEELITVASGSAQILHFQLKLAALPQKIEVSATPEIINTESSTTQTLVRRNQIERSRERTAPTAWR